MSIDPMRIYREEQRQSGEQAESYFEYKHWLEEKGFVFYKVQQWDRYLLIISVAKRLRQMN